MTHPLCRVFPVRHHSPIAARHVIAELTARPPKLLLIEGPADASGHIRDLTDSNTVPPVALLYFVRGQAHSTFPIAQFSPEYQAMVTARALGIDTRFCDLPWRFTIPGSEPPPAPAPGAQDEEPARIERCSLDVRWEIEFELAAPDLSTYLESARRLGLETADRSLRSRTREAYMYRTVQQALLSGLAPEDILLVCGAAHAAPLESGDVDLSLLDKVVDDGDAEVFAVPYSFPRFSCVLGYGAGTSYPHFYQAIWDAGGDADRAVCRLLAEICHDLKNSGYTASLADTIDAVQLARNLAGLRKKSAPGPEELVQAVESCLTRGFYERASRAVAARLVGSALGQVAPGADKAPLAREFYRFINHPQRTELLPLTDMPVSRTLELHRPRHVEISRFLHRLKLLDVWYADCDDACFQVTATLGRKQREPARVDSLMRTPTRPNELWRLRWTPHLDGALAVASTHGGTLEEAARRVTAQKLPGCTSLFDAVALFLLCDRAGLDALVPVALTKVEDLTLTCTQLPVLARAAVELITALRYGAGFASAERTRAVSAVMARRAIGIWAAAPRVPDEDVMLVAQALEQLLNMRAELPDRVASEITRVVTRSARSSTLAPRMAGVSAAIALRYRLTTPLRVVSDVLERLMDVSADGADYLSALLQHAREAFLASGEATDALRDFVLRLTEEQFILFLPVLRKGFATSAPSEIRYFMSLISAAPGEPAKRPSKVTRRINRCVEQSTTRVLSQWLSYAS